MPLNRSVLGVCFVFVLPFFAPARCAFAQAANSNQNTTQDQDKSESTTPQPDEQQGAKPSLITPLAPKTEDQPYAPVTERQRLRWFITNTIGPSHLAGGLFTSAFGTAVDRPKEYGPHWGGFADRYGMRMTGIVTSNAMEATLGAAWGEDPRYFRVPDRPFGARVKNVIRQAFEARNNDGGFSPAYARFAAITGSNFLSNTWRVPSESNVHDALWRTGEGFAGRIAADGFEEFWPDAKRHLFHRNR
jgi:hypothetical protein